jgi:CAAX prenyl protease N-terminal, five membrane helices
MRFGGLLLAVGLLATPACLVASSRVQDSAAALAPNTQQPAPTSQAQPTPPPPNATYALTPERRAKAVAYAHTRYALYFVGTLISLGIYLLLWRAGIAVVFRNWACEVSCRLFVQCLVFMPLFVAAVALLSLPLDYYSGFVVEHRFGLSTQSLASWLAD